MARKDIRQLTVIGLSKAKATGAKLGSPNPQYAARIGTSRIKTIAKEFSEQQPQKISEIVERHPDITLREIGVKLQALGIKTPRNGDQWHASQVSNLLSRLGWVKLQGRWKSSSKGQ
jgi:hypothetical protein